MGYSLEVPVARLMQSKVSAEISYAIQAFADMSTRSWYHRPDALDRFGSEAIVARAEDALRKMRTGYVMDSDLFLVWEELILVGDKMHDIFEAPALNYYGQVVSMAFIVTSAIREIGIKAAVPGKSVLHSNWRVACLLLKIPSLSGDKKARKLYQEVFHTVYGAFLFQATYRQSAQGLAEAAILLKIFEEFRTKFRDFDRWPKITWRARRHETLKSILRKTFSDEVAAAVSEDTYLGDKGYLWKVRHDSDFD